MIITLKKISMKCDIEIDFLASSIHLTWNCDAEAEFNEVNGKFTSKEKLIENKFFFLNYVRK